MKTLATIVFALASVTAHAEGFLYNGGKVIPITDKGITDVRPMAINDSGVIAGFYVAPSPHGFLKTVGKPLTPFPAQQVFGISNDGKTVGWASAVIPGHAFSEENGVFSVVDVPNSMETIALGINDSGKICGIYENPGGRFTNSFLYSNGVYTTLDAPGASFTEMTAINDSGSIVGTSDKGGFLYANGVFTTIAVPGAIKTTPRGISDNGLITGSYTTPNVPFVRGFMDDNSKFTTFDFGVATEPMGINDNGQMVGVFASHTPEPLTLLLLGTGILIAARKLSTP